MTRKKAHVVIHRTGHYRTGEAQIGVVLTDHEVELMREMHEEYPVGHPKHLGYRRLAKIFKVAKITVRRICNYQKRIGGTSSK